MEHIKEFKQNFKLGNHFQQLFHSQSFAYLKNHLIQLSVFEASPEIP